MAQAGRASVAMLLGSAGRRLIGPALAAALVALLLAGAGCTTTVTTSDDPGGDRGRKSVSDAGSAGAEQDAGEDATDGESTNAPGANGADAGAEGASRVPVVRKEVASWGLTIEVPEGWKASNSSADTLATFKAEGPGGSYVRVDETLNADGEYDPMPDARDLDSRLAKKYDDYRRLSLMRGTFSDMPAVLWEFTHTSDDGVHLHKIDWFFQRSGGDPPTAIVVAWPEGDEAAEEQARAILESAKTE